MSEDERPQSAAAGPDPASDAYSRLRELFADAVDLPEDQRAAWIEANVADPGERTALHRLFAADACRNSYLDTPLDEHVARLDHDDTTLSAEGLIGRRFGMFRLVRLLGQGGMAAVFLGQREGGDFEQRVAVKVLRRGLYSEIEQRLFRRERQLLAGLEHPHIARCIDGGVTPAGIPYLVIEYVDGQPITQHAADRQLGVRARLELFLIVCRAVEAAHRALIVHRDIKPSNILIGAEGSVKLLDFGIAKLIEDDAEDHATARACTPEYAAPEQLAGASVTTAADVYALGVLLHELLLGVRPQGRPARRPSSLASASLAAKSAANQAVLPRLLRGDLDTIVLKCLAVEPAQRYASAGALADDIQRHLDGRPVEAHPPSRWYRARKFVQRHRGSVAITAVLALAICASLALALWQAQVARREAARANTVRDFVEEMFAPIQNSIIEDKQTSVHDLLAGATTKLNANSELGVEEKIDLQLLFSRLHEKMGEPEPAQALAQQAARLAQARLAPDDPAALDAQISYAYALLEHDDQAHAEPLLKSVEARIGSRNLLHGMALVRLYDGLATIADGKGDHVIAADYERRALQERVAQYGSDGAKAATGYNNLALSLDMSGQHDAALDAFRRSHAIHVMHEGPDSFETAIARNNLAYAELQAGSLHAAREDFLAVEPLYEAAPNNRRGRNARYWQDRCQLAIAGGAPDARATCDRALQATQRIFAAGEVAWHARALRLDAQLKMDLGDFSGSRADLQRADSLIAPSADFVARGIDEYLSAEMELADGDPARAAGEFSSSVGRIGHAFPAYLGVNALAARALACVKAGAAAPAGACTPDAAVTARRALDAQADPWNPWLLPANIAFARIDLQAGRSEAASDRLRSAIEHAGTELDAAQIHLVAARLWLVNAEAAANRCERAKADWRDSREAVRSRSLEHHPLLGAALAGLHGPACGGLAD